MEEVRCRAKNENNLPMHVFQQLFRQECMKEGQVVNLQYINNIAIATVIR